MLVEGFWADQAGLRAFEVVALLAAVGRPATVRVLDDPAYWGRAITDERYLVHTPAHVT